jgi:hypothetical protein
MDMPTEGTLLEEEGTGLKFVVMDGKLSYVENAGLFDGSAQMVNNQDLESLRSSGGDQISSDAYLAMAEGKGYLVNGGKKRYLASAETVGKYHFNSGAFQDKAPGDLPSDDGPELS